MNDPHVVALIYRVQHSDSIDYENAVPLDFDAGAFSVRVENGEARFAMKEHFPTVDAARAVVEPFVRDWEFLATLSGNPGDFSLQLHHPEIIDRAPNPGWTDNAVMIAEGVVVTDECSAVYYPGHYPVPSSSIVVDADAEAMIARFSRYREDRDLLTSVANFCLTVLEGRAKDRWAGTIKRGNAREAAAKYYDLDVGVLRKIGDLHTNRGGEAGARKHVGREREFSQAERDWLEAALKLLIRRVAEVAYDPHQDWPTITMADLPAL